MGKNTNRQPVTPSPQRGAGRWRGVSRRDPGEHMAPRWFSTSRAAWCLAHNTTTRLVSTHLCTNFFNIPTTGMLALCAPTLAIKIC